MKFVLIYHYAFFEFIETDIYFGYALY